jgi:hypothetical protein
LLFVGERPSGGPLVLRGSFFPGSREGVPLFFNRDIFRGKRIRISTMPRKRFLDVCGRLCSAINY